MVLMRIYCECGTVWTIEQGDNWRADTMRQCPNCHAQIDRDIWEREILPAFGAVADANAELQKDSLGYHRPRFDFDVMYFDTT